MMCLDAVGNLINCTKLGEGISGKVLIDKREVLEVALRTNADKVIFAHNHPGGIAAPSKEDLSLTSDLSSVLSSIGIRLADHIIIADNDSLSLASVEKFSPLFR
jgi:DNA repair protein RadC